MRFKRIDERGEHFHFLDAGFLIVRYRHQQAFHFTHRGHGFENPILCLRILQIVRDQRGVPGSAFGIFDNLHFKMHRLGPLGLHVEQVVIEIQILGSVTAPYQDTQKNENDNVIMRVHSLEPCVAFFNPRRLSMLRFAPAFFQADQGGQQQHHAEPTQHDAAGGDNPQLDDSHKVGEHHGSERDGGGDGSRQVAAPGLLQGVAHGQADAVAQPSLFAIAAENVDSEVDAQPDQDGGEYHGNDIEVADDQGGVPHRPGNGHQQSEHREQRLGDAPVKNHEQQGHTDQGILRSIFNIGMSGEHFVGRDHLAARHAHCDFRKIGRQLFGD